MTDKYQGYGSKGYRARDIGARDIGARDTSFVKRRQGIDTSAMKVRRSNN
jgi:hypothetical protein